MDMVETAGSFGLALDPTHPAAKRRADLKKIVGPKAGFDEVPANWFPLTHALNSLNRGMGLPDVYPFVLSDAAIEKLRFIDQDFSAEIRVKSLSEGQTILRILRLRES